MSRELFTKALNRRFLAGIAAVVAFAATAAAQAVEVVGTGNPNLDVPAVQAAVNRGGQVILKGRFSFDRPPTIRTAVAGSPLATVLVSKAVAISGTQDEDGEMASIEAGRVPFYVEAPGARVTIQGLRFVRPKRNTMLVYAVRGLTIASCRIEGMEPVDHDAVGIAINTGILGGAPTPTHPGKPENVSGTVLIVNNDIDVAGGTALDTTLGVNIFSVGVAGAEVEAYVSGNNIRNTNERAINIYQVGGRAYVERNVITTSTISGSAGGVSPDVIHVIGTGSYLIAHNSVHSRYATGAGIRVHNQFVEWPIVHATVVDNDVNMEAPEGTIFGANSAGIDLRGSAHGNVVVDNRIRGRARVALGAFVFGAGRNTGIPGNNAFILNDLKGFEPSLADVFVDAGVTNTLVAGPEGTVKDLGIGTMIVTLPPKGDHDEDRHD